MSVGQSVHGVVRFPPIATPLNEKPMVHPDPWVHAVVFVRHHSHKRRFVYPSQTYFASYILCTPVRKGWGPLHAVMLDPFKHCFFSLLAVLIQTGSVDANGRVYRVCTGHVVYPRRGFRTGQCNMRKIFGESPMVTAPPRTRRRPTRGVDISLGLIPRIDLHASTTTTQAGVRAGACEVSAHAVPT